MSPEKSDLTKDLASLKIDRNAPPAASSLPSSISLGGVKPLWISLGVAVVVVVVGIGLLGSRREAPDAGVTEVEVVHIPGGSGAGLLLTANGYIVSKNRAALGFGRSGKIRSITVEESQRVPKGMLLATLENLEIEARLDDARHNFQRKKSLFAEQLISNKEFEDAQTALKIAESQWQDTAIRAPFSGIVVQKLGEVGETVSAFGASGTESSGIIILADLQNLEVEVDINETNLGRVTEGTRADIIPDAFPDKTFKGHIIAIRPTADRAKATVRVKVRIENPDGKLLPEMGARVAFLPPESKPEPKKSILIPKGSIQKEGSKAYIYVMESGVAHKRELQLGAERENQVEVASGLVGGEDIIVKHSGRLVENIVVKLKGGNSK